MSADTLLVVLVAVVMVIGVAGTVLPILPGLWVIWGAAAFYGTLAGFGTGGWIAMAAITVLAAAGTASAFYLPQRSATAVGVPWWGQVIALGFAVAGFFLVPVVGAPLGFVVGILLTTIVRERHVAGALKATWATLKSMLIASGVQLAAGVVMMLVWAVWVIRI
ncbi:MAG: DUF456 domain-containing protein [Actinomycetota bacterium]|nr:DUF456 domain-containing protein [Actinomycetota bacterium]